MEWLLLDLILHKNFIKKMNKMSTMKIDLSYLQRHLQVEESLEVARCCAVLQALVSMGSWTNCRMLNMWALMIAILKVELSVPGEQLLAIKMLLQHLESSKEALIWMRCRNKMIYCARAASNWKVLKLIWIYRTGVLRGRKVEYPLHFMVKTKASNLEYNSKSVTRFLHPIWIDLTLKERLSLNIWV